MTHSIQYHRYIDIAGYVNAFHALSGNEVKFSGFMPNNTWECSQLTYIHTYIRVCLCKLYLFICGTYISVSHCLYACLSLPSVCRCWRCISPNKIWATWAHLICRSEVIQVHCNPAESWLHRHGYIYIYIHYTLYIYDRLLASALQYAWLLAFVSASVCQVFNFNCENESEKQTQSRKEIHF